MATREQSPSFGVKDMTAPAPYTFQFLEVGENQIAAAAGRRADESPWWKIPANVWLDGAWQERAWFPSPLLYTALTRLQQLVNAGTGRDFKVDDRVQVEKRAGSTTGMSWLVTTTDIKQDNGYPFIVDTETDNLAAVVTEAIPAAAPGSPPPANTNAPAAPNVSSPPPAPPAAPDTPFVHKEPFVPPAPPADVKPSYGTSINAHYIEQAHVTYKALRVRFPELPEDTASALQARAATAQIWDEKHGVDQAALVTIPGYPIAVPVSSDPAPAPAAPKMNVTADDIPF